MLDNETAWMYEWTEEDRMVYARFLPPKHPLLDALKNIPWDEFVPQLMSYYNPDLGQRPVPPLLMFKLEFLRYFCRLSEREVIARAQTDVLFRWFLQFPIHGRLPNPSLLCKFRGRLGEEGFKTLFDRLVGYARAAGLVRDQLRLKDASHVIANIAVPTTLSLLSQLRSRMLQAIAPLDNVAARGFEMEVQRIRQETESAEAAVKLQSRLDLVQDILYWIVQQNEPVVGADDPSWRRLQAVRQLAEKIVGDLLNPQQGHRTLSVVDPDARRGKHGQFFDGYLVDVMMDADSELITGLEVMPADGDEAQDTVRLVETEHQTHGNQIEQLSIDGIGFNGEMLRKLEDPEGLGVDVITVPREFNTGGGYPASMFETSEDGMHVTCPAGKKSSYRQQNRSGVTFQFKRIECESCPLVAACHPKLSVNKKSNFGRSVSKSEYAVEYDRAREKAATPEYAEVRRRHPAIERKLNEIVRHQRGRFARYWGLSKVKIQQYMTCFTVNVKRISRLLQEPICADTSPTAGEAA